MLPIIYIATFLFIKKEYIDSEELYYIVTGSSDYYNSFIITTLSLIINFSFILYTIYIFNMYYNNETMFLRISKKKWMLSNFISIIIIDIIILSYIYIIVILYNFIIYDKVINVGFINIVIILISKFLIQIFTILGMQIIPRFSQLLIGIFIIYPFIFKIESIIYIQSIANRFGYSYTIILEIIMVLFIITFNFIYINKNSVFIREEKHVH